MRAETIFFRLKSCTFQKIVVTLQPNNTLNLMLMKKVLLSMLLLCSVSAIAVMQNVVAVYQLDGQVAYFSFASRPEATYSATDLILTTNSTSVQYPINRLRKLSFEVADIDEGISDIDEPKHFSFRDGQIIIENGTPDAMVNIYSIQGILTAQYRLDSNGNAAIKTNGLRGTAYILTTGSISFKFMQP